jgi:hypothetical protein
MHRTITFIAAMCTTIVAVPVTAPAQALGTQVITCESYNHGLRECRIPAGSRVRILAQLSAAECRENVSWGVDRDHIWVDRGCRARFELTSWRRGRAGGLYGTGGRVVIRTPVRGRRALHGVLGRAQAACFRRAQAARVRVVRVSDWSHERRGVVRADMWVRGRGVAQRVECEYDPHRDRARLDWRG